MKVNFINPVIQSTLEVLSTMAELEPKAETLRKKDPTIPIKGKHITGLMGMTGDNAYASIALTFSEPVIIHIAQRMLPTNPTEINGTVIDLAGELANMVMGGAKTALEKEGYSFTLGLPTIIVGNEYLIAHRTKAPIVQVPFTMTEGTFYIEASYQSL